ncbi:MAG: DUF4190 domain-containing protein [Flavobacteriales bacterium]|jgi:hypothetical protein|nr:DUF4190 domain-containing protein [Flavobacteriales bacterium]
MKKIVLLLVTLFSLNAVTYASFPVTENGVKTEIVSENTNLTMEAPVRGGGPGMGIAALCCGILGFFFLPFLLGPLAIIFGALGLKNSGRGMAIAGLVLGSIQVLLVLIVILLVGAAISSGLY